MSIAFLGPAPLRGRQFRDKHTCPARVQIRASLGTEIENALIKKFAKDDIQRVVDSFRAVREGRILEKGVGTPQHQHAASFIEGLSSSPYHSEEDHPWTIRLRQHWESISAELRDVMSHPRLLKKGTNVWAKPVVEEANAYGPNWRTLVLQDREWDPKNASIFPITTKILKDPSIGVPSVEAFFARQSPNTGIKLHTDDCNFILTMHLGLDVPPRQSWIEVAGERRYWENGKNLIFDTSFYHETMNESADFDRIVLLLRFWHPELTSAERNALQFLFRAIEDPSSIASILDSRMEERVSKQQERLITDATAAESTGSRAERRKKSIRAKKSGTSPMSHEKARGFGK